MENPAFANWRNLIIDMDGVLWRGQTPLPGLEAFFDAIRATGRHFVLATNNATRTVEQYVERLAGYGVSVAPQEVLTSAVATAQYLAERAAPGARVYSIGEAGLIEALREQGMALIESDAQFVVVGMDRDLTWEKLTLATLNIRAGAVFLGTNPDKTFPSERGIIPGNGAILAALQAATDVVPEIVGKPEPILYRQAMARLGGTTQDTLAIGDRLETDILGATRAGIGSLLVMTGITTPQILADSEISPTIVLPGLPELSAQLLAFSLQGR